MSESSRCVWVIFLRAGAVLPFIAILGESGPLFEVRWDVKRFEGLFKRVTPAIRLHLLPLSWLLVYH